MSLETILLSIFLPVLAWLLLSANKTERRLTRIETWLKFLVEKHGKHDEEFDTERTTKDIL